ncbi:MAG: TonB-dependent receptor plug domain-containing protein, partial [Candidatus Kapaibacterium sp.]
MRGSRYPSDPSYRTSVVYGQWEGNPVDRLHYSLSARYDANSEFGDNLNPKLAVMVEPIPQLRLRGSVGTGFKAPDFRQLYVVFRNNLQGAGYVLTGARLVGEDLKAERSLSADVSLSYDAAYATHVDSQQRLYVHADIRAFENRISEMIEFYLWRIEGQTSVYSYRNVSRVRTRGMETNVRFDVVTDAADSLLM